LLLPSQKARHHDALPVRDHLDSHDPAGSYVHRQDIYAEHGAKKLARWSMAGNRELIALSETHTPEALADHSKRQLKPILAKAKRLGLSIKKQKTK
jgi:hypothetical protein